jgi:hypothetical protein
MIPTSYRKLITVFVGLARRALIGHPDGTVEERLQPQGP